MLTVLTKSLWWTILPIVVLFCASGCIPVEDLGPYWDKGEIDPQLEGHWRRTDVQFRSQDHYISFLKSDDCYMVKASSPQIPIDIPEMPQTHAKTFQVGPHKFLIFNLGPYYKKLAARARGSASKIAEATGEDVDAGDYLRTPFGQALPTGGGLQRYMVEDGVLSFYMLNDNVLAEEIKKGNVKGRSPTGDLMMPALLKLDAETVQFLSNLASQQKLWGRVERYERIDDLEKALQKSREYPATEQTPKNTLIDIDLPDLKYFAEGKTHILLRHLQASPEWRVFIEGQRMVCHRRKRQYGRWNDADSGFHQEFLDEYSKSEDSWFPIDDQDRASPMNERNWQQMRYLFRFEKEPFGYHPTWAKQSHVMKVSPLEGRINIKLKASDQSIESYLAIGQPGLWFEVFEQTWHEERKKTRNALRLLKEFLRALREAEEEIQTQGYAPKLMPPEAIRKGSPTLEVKWDRGTYRVHAWVNPAQQGYVYLRLFNADTQEYLSENLFRPPSEEYIGFSSEPTTLFSYNCQPYMPGARLEQSFNAGFELWLHPSDGTPDRKLISTEHRILPDRERTIDTTRSGMVLDKSDRPVSDAQVTLLTGKRPTEDKVLPFECKVVATTATNRDGCFTMTFSRPYLGRGPDITDLFVVVQKDDYGLGTDYFHSLEASPDKAIILSESATVAGKVVDEDGSPVEQAEVHVLALKKRDPDSTLIGLLSSTDPYRTTTDRFGRFAFDYIPIEAKVHFYVAAEGYLDKFTWDYFRALPNEGKFEAGAPDVTIVMEVLSGISGRIINKHTNLPVPGLRIALKRLDRDRIPALTPVTDQHGRFSVNCPAGSYAINYDASHSPSRWVGEDITVIVESGKTTDLDLTASRTGELTVQVNHADTNEPISNVLLKIRSNSTGKLIRTRNTAGQDGTLWMNLPPGQYIIEQLVKNGEDLLHKSESITIEPGGEYQRTYRFADVPAGTLGIVTDESGKPVAGVNIFLLPGNIFLGKTAAEGRFRIFQKDFEQAVLAAFGKEHLENRGTYGEFYVYAQDTANIRASFTDFYSDRSGVINVVLADAFDISGRVVDAAGRPIPDALVYPRLRMDYEHFAFGNKDDFVTDSDGYYRIRALPFNTPHNYGYVITATREDLNQEHLGIGCHFEEGLWKFTAYVVSPDELFAYVRKIPLGATGNQVPLKDLVLKTAGLSVSGIVVDTLGNPIPNAKITLTGEGQADFAPVQTGPSGKFAFQGLSEGKVKLRVESQWKPGRFSGGYEFNHVETVVDAASEDIRITMTPGQPVIQQPEEVPAETGLVQVFVADSHTGQPIYNASVIFEGTNLANKLTANTNPQGVAYAALAPGTYSLTAVGGRIDYKSKSVNTAIDIQPGQTHTVHVELTHKPGFRGVVLDEQGRPVAGALLELTYARMDQRELITRGNGRFSFTFEPSSVFPNLGPTLKITHERRSLSAAVDLTKHSGEDLTVVLKPAPPEADQVPLSVAVTVIDVNGNPVPKAAIEHYGLRYGELKSQRSRPVYTDNTGQATLTLVAQLDKRQPERKHLLLITDWMEIQAGKCIMEADIGESLILQIEPRVTPVGRVIDSQGNPVAGATVSIYLSASDKLCGHTRTNSQGQYSTKPVPRGFSYTASSHRSGDKFGRAYFTVSQSHAETVSVNDIVLPKR